MAITGLRFHHVGLVVPDLEAAIAWTDESFGLRLLVREPDTNIDGAAIRMPRERVRLRGALLGAGSDVAAIEFHQYLSPVPTFSARARPTTPGPSHIAWQTNDIQTHMAALARLGVEWTAPAPSRITTGPYQGRLWIHGWAPHLHTTVELLQEPA